MEKLKRTTLLTLLSLLLVSSISFATGDEEDEPIKPGSQSGQTSTDEECGFFCTIGEFFEDIFG